MDPAVGKILGMAMAYAVSSLGLLLAYYNYRKRIVKAESVFTPTAWAIIALAIIIAVSGTAWLVFRQPEKKQACVCVSVVNKDGQPVKGAKVYATGETYRAKSETAVTDDKGQACVTVRNSLVKKQKANLFVKTKDRETPVPNNPVETPAVMASCSLNLDCSAKCQLLPAVVKLDLAETDLSLLAPAGYQPPKPEAYPKILGIISPIIIFGFSFWITWVLYKHFVRKLHQEAKSGQ
jgi:hypothetical protein